MTSKVSVRNLAATTDSEALRQAFVPYGRIVEVSVARGTSGTATGSVTFAGDRAAAMAMSVLDGAYLEGRRIEVRVEEH